LGRGGRKAFSVAQDMSGQKRRRGKGVEPGRRQRMLSHSQQHHHASVISGNVRDLRVLWKFDMRLSYRGRKQEVEQVGS
jgi:hypothetical protein